jgi:hypothetical protein
MQTSPERQTFPINFGRTDAGTEPQTAVCRYGRNGSLSMKLTKLK